MSLLIDNVHDYLTNLDTKFQDVVSKIHAGNPEFSKKLLLEQKLETLNVNDEKVSVVLETLDACYSLKFALYSLYTGLEPLRTHSVSSIDPQNLPLDAPLESVAVIEKCLSLVSLPSDVEKELQLMKQFHSLFLMYVTFANYQHLVVQVLKNNLRILDSYTYFASLFENNSISGDVWKTYHFVRILPSAVWAEFRSRSSTESKFGATSFDYWGFVKSLFYEFTTKISNFIRTNSKIQVNVSLNSFQPSINSTKGFYNKVAEVVYYPRTVMNGYFESQVNKLSNLQEVNIAKLGVLISEIPTFESKASWDKENSEFFAKLKFVAGSDMDEKFLQNFKEFSNVTMTAQAVVAKLEHKFEAYDSEKPSFLQSYWPNLLILAIYGPSLIKTCVHQRTEIYNWITENLVSTAYGFYENWIKKPVLNILKTIRHDENSQISLIGKKSLSSDLESLERMILDYMKVSDDATRDLLRRNIQEGDLTPFMKSYETQISSPVKSILFGDLLRSLLIQVQKTKVDGDLVVSGIDKLLKSQELVFESIAVLPTGVILIWLLKNFKYLVNRSWTNLFSLNFRKHRELYHNNLANVERYLIHFDEKDYILQGKLVVELLALENNGKKCIMARKQKQFLQDVADLRDKQLPRNEKLLVVQRMFRSYQ